MTCNILVLFTNDSKQLASKFLYLISHFGEVTPTINAICLDNKPYNVSNVRGGTKSKINIIFFSPDFLKFLENKPLDAYHICGKLEASSTVALFCNGLTEGRVLCFHMAPLKSFNDWCKFEVKNHVEKPDGNFPDELIGMIRHVVEHDDGEPVEIIIEPKFLNRVR